MTDEQLLDERTTVPPEDEPTDTTDEQPVPEVEDDDGDPA